MDRLRQAVGDEQLNYLGTSYGTYLGPTYANLFPDRIRAMVLDGVINPPSYASFDHGDGDIVGPDTHIVPAHPQPSGRRRTRCRNSSPQCAAAGPDRCAFAAPSAAETSAKFDALMDRAANGTDGRAGLSRHPDRYLLPRRDTCYGSALPARRRGRGLARGTAAPRGGRRRRLPGYHPDASVGHHRPRTATATRGVWPTIASTPTIRTTRRVYPEMARGPRSAPRYFGTLWTYLAMPCALWPAEDADRYMGPWDAETSAPILLISRLYDPATPHGGAMAAAETLANARLLTIDGWGHGSSWPAAAPAPTTPWPPTSSTWNFLRRHRLPRGCCALQRAGTGRSRCGATGSDARAAGCTIISARLGDPGRGPVRHAGGIAPRGKW